MHYTYVLLSEKDGAFYTGYTSDLRKRVQRHVGHQVRSTAYRTPLALVYYEACLDPNDALRRERFLKTGKGKRYIKGRLKRHLAVKHDKLERH